jgi:S-adenosylmethionine:tRNA ribosyltransferase-isomerase
MTTLSRSPVVAFTLDADHEAHEPPEARGMRRDAVRLLVSPGDEEPLDAHFTDLPCVLAPGDLLVVNTSATIPAAFDGVLPGGEPIVVHLSGTLPGGVWLVEVRRPHEGSTVPMRVTHPVDVAMLAGGIVHLLAPFSDSERLWLAKLDLDEETERRRGRTPGTPQRSRPDEETKRRRGRTPGTPERSRPDEEMDDVIAYAFAHGRPIRYRHVDRDWPLTSYETIFAREPGSAEMPSASRPFSNAVVTDLVTRGVLVTPLLLHTGVSSLEGAERPYPERYQVPTATAANINAVRAGTGRVIAVGTTVVRALATVTDEHGVVHPGEGWTDTVVTPDTPVTSVDGLVTGWHEPESSHLTMLRAFASTETLRRAYEMALARGYLWHEFGDSHLILRSNERP